MTKIINTQDRFNTFADMTAAMKKGDKATVQKLYQQLGFDKMSMGKK